MRLVFFIVKKIGIYVLVTILSIYANIVIKRRSFEKLIGEFTTSDKLYNGIFDIKYINRLYRITECIEDLSYIIPWRLKCFESALILLILCRVLRLPLNVFFGIKYDDSHNPVAHAWTGVDSHVFTGRQEYKTFKCVYSRAYIPKKIG